MRNSNFQIPYFMRTDDEIRGFFLRYADKANRDYIRHAPIEDLRNAAMNYEMPQAESIIYYDYDTTGGYVAVIDWFSGRIIDSDLISRTENILHHNVSSDVITFDAFKSSVIGYAELVRKEFDSVRIEYRPNLRAEFELNR